MSIFDGLMYALDTPGALTRGAIGNLADVLTGKDRTHGFRASGREMLGSLGFADENEVGPGFDTPGLLADLIVDPLNIVAGVGLAKGIPKAVKAAKAISTARKAEKAASVGLTAAKAAEEIPAVASRLTPTIRKQMGRELASEYAKDTTNLFSEHMTNRLGKSGFGVRTKATPVGDSTNVTFTFSRDGQEIGDAITSFGKDGGMSLSWIGTKGRTGLLNPYFSAFSDFAKEYGLPVKMKDASKTGVTGRKFRQFFEGAIEGKKSRYEWRPW